jgi:hypothetical protein
VVVEDHRDQIGVFDREDGRCGRGIADGAAVEIVEDILLGGCLRHARTEGEQADQERSNEQ